MQAPRKLRHRQEDDTQQQGGVTRALSSVACACPALRRQQADAQRHYPQGQRRHAHVEQHDEAIGRGRAFPSRGKEESGGHEDRRGPDAVARKDGEDAAHLHGTSRIWPTRARVTNTPACAWPARKNAC